MEKKWQKLKGRFSQTRTLQMAPLASFFDQWLFFLYGRRRALKVSGQPIFNNTRMFRIFIGCFFVICSTP